MLTHSEKLQLDESGYLILPGLIGPELLETLRGRLDQLLEQEGEEAGAEFKHEPGARRLANLVNKGEVFERIIVTPTILECMEHVLGRDFKLSSLNARSANPYNHCTQPLHADSGAVADGRGYWVCNSIWMLDDFTAENGAIRMIPGSHRWRRLPPPGTYDTQPGECLLTGTAGTVVIMNAHMWHGAAANRTAAARRAMHVYYTRSDKPQQQYQKNLLSAEVQARLTPLARKILALDDPSNDRICSQEAGVSGFLI